jgi:hypothetical protein
MGVMEIRRIPGTIKFVIQEGKIEILVERMELETDAVRIVLHPLPARMFNINSLRQLGEPNKWRSSIIYVPTEQFVLIQDYQAQRVFHLTEQEYVATMQRAKFISMARRNLKERINKLLHRIDHG